MRAPDPRKRRANRAEGIVRQHAGPHEAPQGARELGGIREGDRLAGGRRPTENLNDPLAQGRHEEAAVGERLVDCVLEGAGGLQALEELGLLLPQKIRGVAGAQGERRALAQVQTNPAIGALGGAAEPTGPGEEDAAGHHELVEQVRAVALHTGRQDERFQSGGGHAHAGQLVDGGQQLLLQGGLVEALCAVRRAGLFLPGVLGRGGGEGRGCLVDNSGRALRLEVRAVGARLGQGPGHSYR